MNYPNEVESNIFEELGKEVGELVAKKQLSYGDSFSKSGECLRQMFPDGVPPDKLDNVLIIARILDKLFRIATDENAFGEDPFRDIAGYSLLGLKKSKDLS